MKASDRKRLCKECEKFSTDYSFRVSIVRRNLHDAMSPCAAVRFGQTPWRIEWRAVVGKRGYGMTAEASDSRLYKVLGAVLTEARDILEQARKTVREELQKELEKVSDGAEAMGGKVEKSKKPCERCNTLEGVTFAPDPFLSDVHDDATDHYLCEDCRAERRDAI